MKIRCPRHRMLDAKLLQVEQDEALELLVQRRISYNEQTGLPVRAGWEELSFPGLTIGVYCLHCLEEGRREPLDLDEIEHDFLGRNAYYFPPANSLNIDSMWPHIERRFHRQIVHWHDVPGRSGIYDHPKLPLPPPLVKRLTSKFPRGLYRHQALATDAVRAGQDVVVATPTASGKSLCYVLPVLATLLEDPTATAIYVAPTQALAEDQFDQWLGFSEKRRNWGQLARQRPEWNYMREVYLGDGKPIVIARYDGGTDSDAAAGLTRQQLRHRIRGYEPRIVITTPESLHSAILGNPQNWTKLLGGLRFVILDEMHSYTGLFGASMAQVLRRLHRHCDAVGTKPQFIGCSATIRNADELGLALLGRQPEVIGPRKDGSPRRRRRFVIMDSARAEELILATARNLMVELVRRRRLRTILFTRSIPEVDVVYNRVRESLQEQSMEDLVCSFKAVLPSHAKKAVAEGLRSGLKAGVVSTNALELGVDIGELSAAVLVKFPGSMSSLLQQSGRVGRHSEGLVFLLADGNPLNQFFVQHPEEFGQMTPEEVYLDPDHRYAVMDHLLCAAQEYPLDLKADVKYFGPALPDLVHDLTKAGLLRRDDTGRYVTVSEEFYAAKTGLRNQEFFPVPINHLGIELARESSDRALRALHKFARIQLENALYEVTSLRLNWREHVGRAEVRLVGERDFVTAPVLHETGSILEQVDVRDAGDLQLEDGMIQLKQEVVGFYRIPVGLRAREEERTFQGLGAAAPPPRLLDTQATWFTLPESVMDSHAGEQLAPMLRSMQKALVLAACIHLRCDSGDLDGFEMPDQGRIFLYDTQTGGSGLAAKVYQHFTTIWATAERILGDCPFCQAHPESRGCPKCVTDEFGLEDGIDRCGAMALFAAIEVDA